MKAVFTTSNTSQVAITMAITMPLADWQELLGSIEGATKWPASDFRGLVSDGILKIIGRIEEQSEWKDK